MTVSLLVSKEFKNLKDNIIAFLAGFAITALPFFAYFGFLGEMKSFLHGTIFYNIEYSSNMSPWVIGASGENWKAYLMAYLPAWSIFIASALAFARKSWRVGLFYLLMGLAENVLFFKGALYSQYGMIALPQIILLLNELVYLKNNEGQKVFKYCALSILAIFCSTIMVQKIQTVPNLHSAFKDYSNRGWEELMAYIPEEEKDSFVAYGGNQFKELYLTEDILPCYKYFVIQEWHSLFSENMRENIHDMFATGDAKWILTDENVSTIKDVLDEKYEPVATSGTYTMYSKK